MAFERPTIQELIARIQSDAESRMGKKAMRWTLVPVLSRVIAGVSHALHGRISFVLRQVFSSTAEGAYLERRASEYGIYRKQASSATGTVTFVGESDVPSGTQIQTDDDVIYITTAKSVDGVAPIRAVAAGSNGNASAGMELRLISPIAGVQSTCTAGELTGGADAEDDESLRDRLLQRQKNPPKAGTKADYVSWALAVSGVTRAWCYPQELGQGHVTVRFMTDGMTENGIPNETMIQRVTDYIENQMPVTAVLHVEAPIPKKLDITLDVFPEDEKIKAKIKNAIEGVILSEAVPGGPILRTSLDRAISSVGEVSSYRLISPIEDVPTKTGEILVPGKITWE
ncbi:MAG: baseplate J/gp47 family protein [Sutterella wadsworthensis]